MGDHRAVIKLEFNMHGHKAEQEMCINWFDNGISCDERIIEWFSAQRAIAMANYEDEVAKYFAKQRAAELEKQERAELARLQEKYKNG